MGVKVEPFGEVEDGKVQQFTLQNKAGMTVKLINYGATITSIKVPDNKGNIDDVCLGFDDIDGYLSKHGKNPYFGAVVGRVANRIANGKFTVDGVEYKLALNNGPNALHGGLKGLDKVLWKSSVVGDKVVFSYVGPDGEEGYPGTVVYNVAYSLNEGNGLELSFLAMTDKATPINLANHVYFNLAGHKSGSEGLYRHNVVINADHYTPVSDKLIPTGEIAGVTGTVFDLRNATNLGTALPNCPGGDNNGYDHNFAISDIFVPSQGRDDMRFVSRVVNPDNGRVLETYSNQKGVQFYTGNFIPNDGSLKGKDGATYGKHGGFCLETQIYPDSVNQPNFPEAIVRPGQVYDHRVTYKFSVWGGK